MVCQDGTGWTRPQCGVATGYADCNRRECRTIGLLPKLPVEAVENDVHAVGVFITACRTQDFDSNWWKSWIVRPPEDILLVIAGGVIPAQRLRLLYKAGVATIFGPGTCSQSSSTDWQILLPKKSSLPHSIYKRRTSNKFAFIFYPNYTSSR